jgi:hypothetical protein
VMIANALGQALKSRGRLVRVYHRDIRQGEGR